MTDAAIAHAVHGLSRTMAAKVLTERATLLGMWVLWMQRRTTTEFVVEGWPDMLMLATADYYETLMLATEANRLAPFWQREREAR